MQANAEESRHMTLTDLCIWVRARQERSGVWNPHFYFRKSKMVRRETPEKKKSPIVPLRKTGTLKSNKVTPCPPPPLPSSFFLWKRLQRGHLQVILLGVCEIKERKKKNKEMRESNYIWNNEKSLELCLMAFVTLQGHEEGCWWVNCPGNRPALSREPERHPQRWKNFV